MPRLPSEPEDQRHIDRAAELAKQKEVTDALAAHGIQSRKDAEAILAGELDPVKVEQERLDDIRAHLNESVERAAKGAKA